jgi:hypothetical protein
LLLLRKPQIVRRIIEAVLNTNPLIVFHRTLRLNVCESDVVDIAVFDVHRSLPTRASHSTKSTASRSAIPPACARSPASGILKTHGTDETVGALPLRFMPRYGRQTRPHERQGFRGNAVASRFGKDAATRTCWGAPPVRGARALPDQTRGKACRVPAAEAAWHIQLGKHPCPYATNSSGPCATCASP